MTRPDGAPASEMDGSYDNDRPIRTPSHGGVGPVTDTGYSDGLRTNGRRGNLVRFSQIGRVLLRHGFGFVFDVRRDRREKRGAKELLGPNFGVRLRQTLDDLGPTFVKFGQLLSTRADIIPESILLELQKLQD